MDKTSIYLIRHGECAGNRENRVRGRVDFPLNGNGIAVEVEIMKKYPFLSSIIYKIIYLCRPYANSRHYKVYNIKSLSLKT